MDNKKIYDLKLFEEYNVFIGEHLQEIITRVPGGWVYYIASNNIPTSCFIPFDNEFQGGK